MTLKELIEQGIIDEWTPQIPVQITEIKETKNRTQANRQMTKCKISDSSGEKVGCWIYSDQQVVTLGMSAVISGMLKEYNGKKYLDYCKVERVLPSSTQNTPKMPQNAPQSTNRQNKGNEPDWDAIAEGKVRSLFVQAAIQSKQIVCESAKDILYWTEFAMTGLVPAETKNDDDIPF